MVRRRPVFPFAHGLPTTPPRAHNFLEYRQARVPRRATTQAACRLAIGVLSCKRLVSGRERALDGVRAKGEASASQGSTALHRGKDCVAQLSASEAL